MNILFRLALVGVLALLLVRPAAAVLEQVAPESGGWKWYVLSYSAQTGRATPLLSCQAYIALIPSYTFSRLVDTGVDTSAYAPGQHTHYCYAKNSSGVEQAAKNIYPWIPVIAGVCPTPATQPEIPYSWVQSTGYCEREYVPPPADPCAGVVITETFEITSACLSSDPASPTCAPSSIAHACGTLVKSDQYDCLTNATQTMCSAVYGSALEPVQGAPSSPPSQACPSGKSLVTGSNGFSKCYADSTGAIASAVAASQSLTAGKFNDAMTAAAAAASSVAGAAAGATAAGVVAAGGISGGSGTGSAAAPLLSKNQDVANVCADDPRNPICQDNKGAGGVAAAPVSGLYVAGDLIPGKTFSSSVSGFKSRVLASGVGGAAGSFFTVNQAGGSCPVWSVDAPMIGVLSFDFYCTSTFQNLLPWIRSVILLVFSVVAFRIAIL